MDGFTRHEALHTSFIMMESIDSNLIHHFYYISGKNPEFNKKIDEAMKALAEAYQLCDEENENV